MAMTTTETDLVNTKKVGLIWDEYTPAVEAQICRDMLALQNQPGMTGSSLVAVCDQGNADKLLKTLGIRRLPLATVASLWIVYKALENPVDAPEHAEEIIVRDLYQEPSEPNIDPSGSNGYYLKPQGRPISNQLNIRKPPPNAYVPVDPALVMLYSSKIE